MDKTKVKQYATLDAKRRVIEAEMNALKIEILSDMEDEGITKAETNYGRFTHGSRITWKYSDKVTSLQEKLKIAQVKEQHSGTAKKKTTEYLMFTPKKK